MPKEKETKADVQQIQHRFYYSYPAADPHIRALVTYLQRKNSNSDFVEKTIQRVGLPVWNKSQIYKNGNRAGRGQQDSVTYTYIPFSRENENFVNASLVIQTTPTDTTTNWICDWQYKDMPRGNISSDGTAENTAVFFMRLHHATFGDSLFVITDSSLFTGISGWSTGERRVKIKSFATGGRGTNQPVYECLDFYECGTPVWCYNQGGCDYLNCPTNQCFLTENYCSCVSNCGGGGNTPPPGSGGGSGGTGGSSGSGGSGGGTPPPPECEPPVANRGMYAQPPGTGCPPGWNVPPPPPPPVAEPIDTLLKRYAEFANRYRDSLSNICENDTVEIFYNIVLYNNLLDTFRLLKSISGDEVNPNYNMIGGRLLKAEWHYHPKYPDGTSGSWPSGSDVVKLFDKPNGHVMIVDTYDARYALVVENLNQMTTWKNIYGNGPQTLPRRIRDSVMADPRVYSSGSIYVQMTKEKLVAALGNSAICGIGLYKATSKNATTFIKEN